MKFISIQEAIKKGKGKVVFLRFYGRCLSMTMITAPTRIMTTMIAATAGRKYWSAIDAGGASVGAGVAAASPTLTAVVAVDGQ